MHEKLAVVICGLVDYKITGFHAQVLTYLFVVTGMSEIKDTVTYQFNLVRDTYIHNHSRAIMGYIAWEETNLYSGNNAYMWLGHILSLYRAQMSP